MKFTDTQTKICHQCQVQRVDDEANTAATRRSKKETSAAVVVGVSHRDKPRRMKLVVAIFAVLFVGASRAWSPSNNNSSPPSSEATRRSFVSSLLVGSGVILQSGVARADDDESFASIAARASKISKAMVEEDGKAPTSNAAGASAGGKTAYDFALPVAGQQVPIRDIVRNQDNRVKAILFVNIKQDDPVARKNIPEFISLAAKYGRTGEFAVVCCPTDQGYYEPDTSALIRLKMASEYGYGINPATIVTDKVNILGTGAHPFWRWLEGTCRTPAGLGRIQANFEKFLVDGQTGLPLRRYPRKYMPYDMQNDIAALIEGKPLPLPGANWKEEWRSAIKEAEADTYRFQKGLNYYDQ